MDHDLEQLLAQIESDMSAGIGTRFTEIAADYFKRSANPDHPVSTRMTSQQLDNLFQGGFPEKPVELEEVLRRLKTDVVDNSIWLYHPRYMGHQVTAPLPAAVWSEVVIGALNNSVAVQEMSPAITMVERQIIRWLSGLVGYPGESGGTLTSGGTEATFTGLLAARARAVPDSWQDGLEGELPVVLCGEHAHYAVTRAVAQLGLGLKRAVLVKSENHRMDVTDLQEKLQSHKKVMAVVATAGSTATGSFDDLEAVADLCEEHGVWLHVDGAHGASALFSESRKHLMKGIQRADSIAWDPHKMMLMPLSAGALLVKRQADLDAAFRQHAPYLFHEVGYDQGGRSFQCSRRADALKLWIALHRYGTRAFGLLFDRFCDLARELYEMLCVHPSFDVVHEPQCNILCFRLRADDAANLEARVRYNTEGAGWITTTVLEGRRVLRVTLINPRIRTEHLRAMLEELAQ